ncbi:MAG: two-component system LytT family sensor kinase, partial [Urechidicola sp.]
GKINPNKSAGLGLENLIKRLEIQYKGMASFSLKGKGNDHVSAEIIIPIDIDDEKI